MTDSLSKFEPVEQLAEEFLARHRRGERSSLSEYTRAYPELAELIQEYFPAMMLMEELGSAADESSTQNFPPDKGKLPDQLGEYRILREMGRGGMGIVYEAVQESLGRHVALKVLPFHGLLDRMHRERFHREARAAARLHHTNIVPVFGVGEHQGIHYYAMQFIHGQSLEEVLQEVRRLRAHLAIATGLPAAPPENDGPHNESAPPDASSRPRNSGPVPATSPTTSDSQACSRAGSGSQAGLSGQSGDRYFRGVATIGVQVAEALEYAHGQGILHRDVKPSNLLLDTSGRVWVTDFGLAKAEDWEELTSPGDVVGTVRYMAPERFGGQADARSDVYGMGITLYEMLTLRPAFEDSNRARLMERIAHDEPPRPRRLDRRIPRDLETVVLKATAKEPARRYATAAAFAEDLRRFLGDRPVQARRTPLRERVWRLCRRNPVVTVLTAAVVLLLLLLTGTALLNNAQLTQTLGEAEAASLEAKQRLWVSLRDRAQALRLSRHAGQRVDSLRSVRQALKLPLPPGHGLHELRTAAIAALALPDLEVVQEWEGFPAGSRDLAFDRNLERYARLAANGAVSVRRVRDDALIAHWQESTATWPDQESYLRFSPDGRFLCTRHATSHRLTVRRLDRSEPSICHEGTGPAVGWVMDFTPDSKQVAYLLADSRIAVVDLASGQGRYLPATGARQEHLCFAPDGRRFAVGAERAGQWAIEIRDAATGQVQQRLPHPQNATRPAWHPDGQVLATCCDDGLIRLWHAASGRLLRELAGHKSLGIRCAFTPTGERLLSNDWNNVLRVWEPSSGRQLLSHPAAGYALLQVSPDERVPAQHVADTTRMQLLRLHAGMEYGTIGPSGYLSRGVSDSCSVEVHPQGRLLAARAADGSLLLVDLAAGREVGRMTADPRMTPLRWQPPSGDLITYGVQGLLHWPLRTDPAESEKTQSHGQTGSPKRKGSDPLNFRGSDPFLLGVPRRYRLGPPKRLLTGDFGDGRWGSSCDGQTIAVPEGDGGAGAFDLKNLVRKSAVRLQPQKDVRWCAVSPDGRWAATGSHDDTAGFAAKVWNAATGEMVKGFPVPGRCRVAFSPDGHWLLTTGGGCRLWQVDSWHEGPRIGGAAGCFSPDGRLLAAEDSAGAIRLLNPDTGAELARLEAPEQTRLQPAGFSPDGTRLIAVGIDTQALHVWDLRQLRQQLAAIGLDWDAPAYAPVVVTGSEKGTVPLEVEILPAASGGCLEAENLKIVDRAGCAPAIQSMDEWDRRQWSQGRQLFCDSRQGGYVVLEVDVAQAGKYSLDIYFTMAPDYGIVEVALDGKQVGNRFDGFSGGVVPSGRTAFGAVQLTRGKHQIRFSAVDKNPASGNYYVGIDCLELKPVKE